MNNEYPTQGVPDGMQAAPEANVAPSDSDDEDVVDDVGMENGYPRQQCNSWMPLEKKVRLKNGQTITVFPFLQNPNNHKIFC
jgi:hypothetical protein